MLIEVALLPRNLCNEGDQIIGTVSVRTFVIQFYYGYGSAKANSYGSYGSGSATLVSNR
jgi:hypothetical protein